MMNALTDKRGITPRIAAPRCGCGGSADLLMHMGMAGSVERESEGESSAHLHYMGGMNMVTPRPDGTFRFEIFLPSARSVAIAGTFCDWSMTRHPMERGENGWWTASLDIQPGDHSFQYVVDGRDWIADFAASGVERNGFGGWVSRLHVKPRTLRPMLDRELDAIVELVREAANRLRDPAPRPLAFPRSAEVTDAQSARKVA